MVSGSMGLSATSFKGGQSVINAQRGTDVWGANYIYNSGGLQNDIGVIADDVLGVSGAISTSGTLYGPTIDTNMYLTPSGGVTIGTAAAPLATSGLIMVDNTGGNPYALFVTNIGTVSGVAL